MKVALHLGAHRTGSTFVARSALYTSKGLGDPRLAVILPRQFRTLDGIVASPKSLSEVGLPQWIVDRQSYAEMRRGLRGMVATATVKNPEMLFMSEENFLGYMLQNLHREMLYPEAETRLKNLSKVLPVIPDVIGLGIRSYGSIWTSQYNFLLRKRTNLPRSSARKGALSLERGWTDIVKDISKVWPKASIFVWRQEDLKESDRAILSQFLGLPEASLKLPDKPLNVQKTPQAEILFDEDELSILEKRYDADVNALTEISPKVRVFTS